MELALIYLLCLDGVTSIATAGEISSIAASGSVLYKAASNSGSDGNSNSSSDKNVDTNESVKVKAEDVEFSDKFSKGKFKNQVAERGWTNEKIADAINNPVKLGESVNKATGNKVKLYFVDDVHYVAVDTGTGKVIQVADLNKPNWVPEGGL